MPSVICTLFEKHYHYGVAALTNSLYQYGYKGPVYAGYHGTLPFWASSAKENPTLGWPGASTLEVADGLQIHFFPIKSDFHFVFYKPYFMLELFKLIGDDIEGIAYFDPDIVIKCKWIAFEGWMTHGVALVHESMDRPPTHPMRGEWRKVISKIDRQVTRELHSYINSGFCGVVKDNIEFLEVWKQVIETAIKDFNLSPERWGQTRDRAYMFYNADQDALNVAAMCCNSPISEIGPEGMDFIPGGFTMSHALGKPKPWNKKFIRSALKAKGPALADKGFWLHVERPISLYSKPHITIQRMKLSVAAFISRFYKRS